MYEYFIKAIIFLAVVYEAQALYLPGYGELFKINTTELFAGIPLPDDLKNALISCIDEDSSEDGSFEKCALDLPIPDALKLVQNLTSLIRNNKLVSTPIHIIDNLKNAVVDPLVDLTSAVQKTISDVPVAINKVLASSEEVDDLIKFSETIEASSSVPMPLDPFQDVSGHLVGNTPIVADKKLAAKTAENLKEVFENRDIETVRQFGSSFNPLVPHTVIAGFLRDIVNI